MKTSPTVRRVAHALDLDLLGSILVRVEADLHAAPDPAAVAFGVLDVDDEGVEVERLVLDPDDPIASLYGTTGPPEWSAFGVVVPGRAYALDDPDDPVDPGRLDRLGRLDRPHHGRAVAVRVGLLVSRSGDHTSLLRRGGEPPELITGGLERGRLPDVCRRVLGLATPAPEGWAGQLWSLMWVESLLVESIAEPGALSWADAVRVHPGVDHVLRLDPDIASELPHRFVEMVTILSRRFGWDRLRALAAEGALAGFGLTPELASWMDEGMFSRHVLGVFAPMSSLLVDLEPVARAELLNGVDEALAAWAML